MLDNPKWLLFALLFFVTIAIFANIYDEMASPLASVTTDSAVQRLVSGSMFEKADAAKDIMTWNYRPFSGSFEVLQWLLTIMSAVLTTLTAIAVYQKIRGF